MDTSLLSEMAVEVLFNRGGKKKSTWSLGSGFVIGSNLVLTASHNVHGEGEIFVRVKGKTEYSASVLVQGDLDTLDLAILKISDASIQAANVRYGAINQSVPSVITDCWTIGFPRFKEREQINKPLRFSAQIEGEIPTAENFDRHLLTLRVKRSPRPISNKKVYESEWAGFSGAVVFGKDNIIIGVITEHHLPEGDNSLTLTPISAIGNLPKNQAKLWWNSLGTSPQKLIPLPLNIFTEYLSRLVFEFENWSEFNDASRGLKKPMMISKMASTNLFREFIPLNIDYIQLNQEKWEKVASGVTSDLISEFLNPTNQYTNSNLLLILGEYGTGKSSYAIRLTYELARDYLADPVNSVIPVYIDLQDYRRFGNIEKFIERKLSSDYLIPIEQAFKKLLYKGKLLLILDGFDEMASRGSLDDTLANFREIKRMALPGVKTILTCRSHYFRSYQEANQVFNQHSLSNTNPLLRELSKHPSYTVVDIQQFTDEQIQELIQYRVEGTQFDQIWSEINKRYNLIDLARRPVLLDMILQTMPVLISEDNQINTATIYEAYTTLWVERDDWRSNLEAQGKNEIMKNLAWNIFSAWRKNSRKNRNQTLEATVDNKRLLEVVGKSALNWLKAPGLTEKENSVQIDYDLRTCSFLKRDSDGKYSFSHRSFLEYFTALYLIDTADSDDSPLLQYKLGSYSSSMHWDWPSQEVVRFMIDILKYKPEKEEQILALTKKKKGYGGNGLTLKWESTPKFAQDFSLGRNLNSTLAYAIDLSRKNLTGADFGSTKLASPYLEGTILKKTKWNEASIRINHVYDVALGSKPNEIYIGSGNGTLSSWDLTKETRTGFIHLHTEYIFDMSINTESNLWAYTTWDGWIHLRNAHDGSQIWSQYGNGAGSGKVLISPKGKYLAGGSWDNLVKIWNCSSDGEEIFSYKLDNRVLSIAFGPFEQYLAVGTSGKCYLIDIEAKKVKVLSSFDFQNPETIAFSPDGKHVAIAAGRFYIVEVSSAKIVYESTGFYGFALAYSASGSKLALGNSSYNTFILNLSNDQRQSVNTEHLAAIKSLQFSKDENFLFSGGIDGTVRVSDTRTGNLIQVIDVGINCFGANLTGGSGFNSDSITTRTDWETWWAGIALKGRLLHCGAITNDKIKVKDGFSPLPRFPKAVWSGQAYKSWLSSLA